MDDPDTPSIEEGGDLPPEDFNAQTHPPPAPPPPPNPEPTPTPEPTPEPKGG